MIKRNVDEMEAKSVRVTMGSCCFSVREEKRKAIVGCFKSYSDVSGFE
jgi:hypothetical protein